VICCATDDESRLEIATVVEVTHATRLKTPESPIRDLAAGSLQEHPVVRFIMQLAVCPASSGDTDPRWWQPMTSTVYLVIRAVNV
jgi:hypothetical protein